MKKIASNRSSIIFIFALFLFSFSFSSAHGQPLFKSKTDYGAGEVPWCITTGDFDGDMILDLAVANIGSDDVSIFLSEGDGTFQAAVHYVTGFRPESVATGDFDGDMVLDLATANRADDTVSILLGVGDGSFQKATHYGTGDGPESVATGDFDGDMILDLATANFVDDNFSILLGVGDGTFQAAAHYVAGDLPRFVATGDFDGDMILDLATANTGTYPDWIGDVSILLGEGDGSFQEAVHYGAGDGPYSIATGDFDGDTILDLAVANQHGCTVSILLGDGDGTFQWVGDYGEGNCFVFTSVATGDFDGDMILDLAITYYPSEDLGYVSIFLGTGDGTFQKDARYRTGRAPMSVATGDFNGDLALDLATANPIIDNVSILINNEPCFIGIVMK